MKKIITLMTMAAIFAACCNEEEFDSQEGNYTLTGYADVESRTAFGTPGSNSLPFVWSAGDYVYAGSTQSNAIINGGSSATFTFASTPSATDVYYNITGTSAKKANVKTEQTAGNLGANGDFGYGTISNGSFTLSHATAYMWFNITALPQGATLEKVTLDAGEVTVAGSATWNGSSFGTISNGSNTIELSVGKTSVSGTEATMVVFPANISSATITYQLKVNGTTKYHQQTLGAKALSAGTTYRIDVNLASADLYEMRVLTFEDADAKFASYTLDYANITISKWSDLIPAEDEQAYGISNLIYDMSNNNAKYKWSDKGNTNLSHTFPYNWGGYSYSGGGAVISCHTADVNTLANASDIYNHQLSIVANGGNNGSSNFCIIYNDSQVNTEAKNEFTFTDNKAHVIDHMYVTLSSVTAYCIINGNQFSNAYGDNDYLKIIATGTDTSGNNKTAEFTLAEGSNFRVTDWRKWNLRSLGAVTKVTFHMVEAQIDDYGYAQYYKTPMYFAFDDVAVQFTE